MYFRRNPKVIYRDFRDFGYITDNRNFSYKRPNPDSMTLGDKILSATGSNFFSKLDVFPKHIDDIVKNMAILYPGVDASILKKDAIDFYRSLESDGFVYSSPVPSEKNIYTKKMEKDYSHETKELTTSFFEEYYKGQPYITNVHIDIISKCNERCVHCYIPHNKKISAMESKLFHKILDQCNDLNIIHITLSGGEPLLHPDFLSFLEKIIENNYSINILTNLVLFNNDFFNLIKDNPLIGIQTSLYSMKPDIHDYITGVKGSFEKTKGAILKLIDANIPIQISCPVLKPNQDSYYSVIEWGNKYQISVEDDLSLIGTYDCSKENLSCRLSFDEARRVITERFYKDKDYMEKIQRNSIEKNFIPEDYACSVCNSSICIADNGDVYPCAGWRGFVIDNINYTTLEDIWYNSHKVKELRRLQKKNFKNCIECPDRNFCTMCLIRNANESASGDYLEVNQYYCGLVKIHKELINEIK